MRCASFNRDSIRQKGKYQEKSREGERERGRTWTNRDTINTIPTRVMQIVMIVKSKRKHKQIEVVLFSFCFPLWFSLLFLHLMTSSMWSSVMFSSLDSIEPCTLIYNWISTKHQELFWLFSNGIVINWTENFIEKRSFRTEWHRQLKNHFFCLQRETKKNWISSRSPTCFRRQLDHMLMENRRK